MKLSLAIADRVSIQQILPDKDSFENLCIRQEILDKTAFTSDEVEKNKIKTIEIEGKNRLTWIETGEIEYEFNLISVNYIKDNLRKMSEAKELTSLQFPLYKKVFEL